MTSEPAVQDVRIGGRRIEIAPHNCFACGTLNVHGLHLELHAGDDRCWVELSLPERFQGWDDIAHGGIVCTILDEVMAWALVESDSWGVTARMQVEFKRPVPIGRRIRGEGRVVEAKRRVVRDFDRAYAQQLLERSNGNVSEAARLAGLDRSNFRRVLRKHEGE